MRPYDVTDPEQFLKMESDNFPPEPEVWSILHNGDHVSLHAPHGEGRYIMIPRNQFNAIVDWYIRHQPPKQQGAAKHPAPVEDSP